MTDPGVVFGATGYLAPIRLPLFDAGENRFFGIAYRVAANSDGSATWMPHAFHHGGPLPVAEHIRSIRIVDAGWPTILEVGDDDQTTLTLKARSRRFACPWRRRGAGLPPRPSTPERTRKFTSHTTARSGCGSGTRPWAPGRSGGGTAAPARPGSGRWSTDGSGPTSWTAAPTSARRRSRKPISGASGSTCPRRAWPTWTGTAAGASTCACRTTTSACSKNGSCR